MEVPGYRRAFSEGLRLLERAFVLTVERGGRLPVIVGGADVEYHTLGSIQSGDFDLVGGNDVIAQALLDVGFQREFRRGRRLGGYFFTGIDFEIGVEFVSGALFGGLADRAKLELIYIDHSERATLCFPSIEDMIADRLGQFEANRVAHQEMLEQARILRQLAEGIDITYLERRVCDECGSAAVLHWLLGSIQDELG